MSFGPPISDGLLDGDTLEYREAIRRYVADQVAPGAIARDSTREFPGHVIRDLGRLGFLGIAVSEDDGGSGGRLIDYAVLIEELAYGCGATSTAVMTQFHGMLPAIVAGTSEQKERWVRPLCAGSSVGAFALTEPDAGSDVHGITTSAERDGDTYRLKGSKAFITNGSVADKICVFARTGSTSADALSAFLVDGNISGVTRGIPLDKLGMRASVTSELFFDNALIDVSNRLGDEGDGWPIAMAVLDKSRVSTAAQSVGLARFAMDRAVAFSRQRRQFGRSIGEFQAVRLRLAEMYVRVEQSRSLLYSLLQGDAASLNAMTAGAAKVSCSDTAMWVATEAVQALGGAGYLVESEVERVFRDAKATQIYDGTNDINRIVIGRELLRSES
jgi:alkylation response protein AidB-like acyl-CoA dehydrogenase